MCHCPGIDTRTLLQDYKEKIPNNAYSDVFVPTYDQMKRYQGAWHIEQKPVFPEYIFLESDQKTSYTDEYVTESSLLLPEQEKLLRNLFGKEGHIPMSVGYIKDGCTHVTAGPLQGKEDLIRKIDRHKRLAKLEFAIGDVSKELYAGLEIISKS
mgnify:CR=1 FL=1